MKIKQNEIWIADLNPQIGTETGKTRPVLIIQTDLLNNVLHPSTIICPITTKINSKAEILRVHIEKGVANMRENSDIIIDQLRSIDNKRFLKKIGRLPQDLAEKVKKKYNDCFRHLTINPKRDGLNGDLKSVFGEILFTAEHAEIAEYLYFFLPSLPTFFLKDQQKRKYIFFIGGA